jgi:hypothetical protein
MVLSNTSAPVREPLVMSAPEMVLLKMSWPVSDPSTMFSPVQSLAA